VKLKHSFNPSVKDGIFFSLTSDVFREIVTHLYGDKISRILVCYYSKTETTEKMAEKVREGASSIGTETEVDLREVGEVDVESIPNYDALVLGSPTYYGGPAAQIKELIDESVTHHGNLEGMVGGAFSSSSNTAGGNETTIIALLEALLIHGMIIQGSAKGDHYGPVVVGSPDEKELEQCKKYGARIAELVEKVRD